MLTPLSETIKKHVYELLDREETIRLAENLKKAAPQLVEETIPALISYAMLERILRNLLKEGVPIKNLGTIVEAAADAMNTTRDPDLITEAVRAALTRTITRRFCEHGQLRVVTLDAEVEKQIVSSLTKNDQGVYLAMGADMMQQIVSQLGESVKKFAELGQTPVILTSPVIRVYLSRMLSQFFPNLYVLSFNEITTDIQIQALGNITMQQKKETVEKV
ncbi:Flagellar biosynthesis protein FlhA [bioreactor metagenome]|uniref:Flagellar biosynthesis protein FlhA n=1 Tax=bioreactor metagenome TaxID=1076179 RepID=A0A645E3B0_9ZZZZ